MVSSSESTLVPCAALSATISVCSVETRPASSSSESLGLLSEDDALDTSCLYTTAIAHLKRDERKLRALNECVCAVSSVRRRFPCRSPRRWHRSRSRADRRPASLWATRTSLRRVSCARRSRPCRPKLRLSSCGPASPRKQTEPYSAALLASARGPAHQGARIPSACPPDRAPRRSAAPD